MYNNFYSQQQQKTTEKLNESLNDSFGITYNYGSGGTFDSKAYEKCLENERQNFKLLSTKVRPLFQLACYVWKFKTYRFF